MRKIILVIILIGLISCKEEKPSKFSLTGKTYGIENGTKIYLDFKESLIDSTEVKSGAFYFQTKLPESPIKVRIYTKDFSEYRSLWLENNFMQFDASGTDFRRARVTGSESENLSFSLYQKIDKLPREERQKTEMKFVRENPNSIVSVYLLSFYSTTWGKEKTIDLFNYLSENNKNSDYGRNILEFIKLNKNPKIGEQYVDFEMKDVNGESRRLSDFKNKIVLLEFWASNCGPCRQENPNLVKTYEEYNPKGFEVFAVSEDTKKVNWLEAIKEDKLPWMQVSDLSRKNTAGMIYGINGIPDNFLISKEGIIVGRNLRGELLNEKLKQMLE